MRLTELIAEFVHHKGSAEADPEEWGIDILEATAHLNGLVRVFGLETFVERIAIRLYEAEYQVPWEDAAAEVRNHFITRALDTLDALKDEIHADPDYDLPSDDDRRLERALDKTEPEAHFCRWCHERVVRSAAGDHWVLPAESRASVRAICPPSPNSIHDV